MEAGNRCFDECLPEETNRRIVDHIADVNLCYSEHARRYLNAEGTAKERTYVTGSPMAEVLTANLKQIQDSDILDRLGLKKHALSNASGLSVLVLIQMAGNECPIDVKNDDSSGNVPLSLTTANAFICRLL